MPNLFRQYFEDIRRSNPFFTATDLAYDTVQDTETEWRRIYRLFSNIAGQRLTGAAQDALRRASDDLLAKYTLEYAKGALDPYANDRRPLQAASFLADFDVDEWLRGLSAADAGRKLGYFGERWYRR